MKNRLEQVLDFLNINKSNFAKEVGMSASNITGLFNGRLNSLSTPVLAKISERYNVSLDWLITGRGSMFASDSIPAQQALLVSGLPADVVKVSRAMELLSKKALESAASYITYLAVLDGIDVSKVKGTPAIYVPKPVTGPKRDIPLLGRIAAGIPMLAEENIEKVLSIPQEFLPRAKKPLFALRVRGSSMTGAGIIDGDIVVLQQVISVRDEVKQGKIVAALIDGEATLKSIYYTNDSAELRAENPAFKSIMLSRKDFAQIQGRLVLVIRQVLDEE